MIKADILRKQIIDLALKQINKPYVHGNLGIDSFDCTGLIWFLYNELLDIDVYEKGFGKSTTTKIMTSKYGKLTLFQENISNKDITIINPGDIVFLWNLSC